MIAKAVASGSRVLALTALRDRLASEIDTCKSARDVAALSLRLMDVLEQLESAARAEKPATVTKLSVLRDDARKRIAG